MKNGGNRKTIGILGGTFDPIHNAHLHLAQKVSHLFGLEEVIFLVSRHPPHKPLRTITDNYHRFAMTAVALEAYPRFYVSAMELELDDSASNYTCDTLQAICRDKKIDGRDLYFIAGGDSFLTIHKWKNFEFLLTHYNFVFVDRPEAHIGNDFSFLPDSVRRRIVDMRSGSGPFPPAPPAVYTLDTGAPDISSSAIRERAAAGLEYAGMIPEGVYQYIKKYRIYP